MTYRTSHLLIDGGIFRGRVKKKYYCVRGGGSRPENKNIGGCVLSIQPDQQKRPQCKKCAKMQNKLSNIEKIFLARFAHSAFYKIHIFGAANPHAPVQYAKYVVFFLFFFFF